MSVAVRTPQLHAKVRAEVALASDVLVPAWPIGSFIAVNPLGGLEQHGFEEAARRAGAALGARGHLAEERFRELAAAGRIDHGDLRAALVRRHPRAAREAGVQLGDRRLSAGDVLLLDLLHAPPAAPATVDRTVGERVDALLGTRIAEATDDEVGGWCAAFLDEGQAAWSMPGRAQGLYRAWQAVAAADRGLRRLGAGDLRAAIGALPGDPAAALLAALARLGVGDDRRIAELRRQLGRGPGWASAIRWRAEHHPDAAAPADLTDLLALRVTLEELLVNAAAVRAFGRRAPMVDLRRALAEEAGHPGAAAAGMQERLRAVALAAGAAWPLEGPARDALARILGGIDPRERPAIWQEAYEDHWRAPLLRALDAPASPAPAERPRATVVCCIDARSEGLRRNLERRGPYETLGFAGFFAVAMRFRGLGSGGADALCPVLLTPRNDVTEQPADGQRERAERWLDAGRRRAAGTRTLHRVREDLSTPFALAEASGWLMGPQALARTFTPGAYGRMRDLVGRAPEPATRVVIDRPGEDAAAGHATGFTHDEQIAVARTALTMMGLVSRFGRLVLLCGHGSLTENNPYEAALDCGACGGNQGGPNARVAAAILNRPHVRDALRVAGIEVPEDTWFLAGQHDTAADTVTVFDRDLVPEGHRADLAALEADLLAAGAANSAERLARLPGAATGRDARDAHRRAARRGRDWAQIRPEWGLARNAAFIVGPRSMTRDLDLECRTFLHSYDAGVDADGSALETILTAPLVVAQWINCQYYFSTVDPERFGAGNKTIHNVVAGLGVLQGPAGDLRLGLPLQGALDGNRLYHEPLRLLAVVQAPLGRIDEIVSRNPVLQHLFGGEWVALAARERPGDPWLRRETTGAWTSWSGGTPVAAPPREAEPEPGPRAAERVGVAA